MKKILYLWTISFTLIFWILANVSYWQNLCSELDWASIIANDWTYLWELSSDSYSKNSIANKYSNYWDKYSSESIFNKYWTYWDKYNKYSPWNKYSTEWPLLIKNNKTLWILTLNKYSEWYINIFSALLCFISISDDKLEPFLELFEDTTKTTTTTYISTSISKTTKTDDEVCKEQYWLYAISAWEPNTCKCMNWYYYHLTTNWTICAPWWDDSDIPLIMDMFCKNSFWSWSKYVPKNWEVNCVCEEWYSLSENNKCINNNTKRLNDNLCKNEFWIWAESSYYWTKTNNEETTCICKNWYSRWQDNNKKSICVNDLDKYIPATQRMYSKWLTSKSNLTDFLPNDFITREQASKFFVEFSKNVLNKPVNTSKKVNFSDLKKADPTLQQHIKESNQLWLFNWVRGNFLPFNKITIAQALAVIIRSKDWIQDEKIQPRYKNYYTIANSYWILEGLWFNFDTLDSTNITRKDVAMLLYRLNNYIELNPSLDKQCKDNYWKYSYFNVAQNKCWCQKRYAWNPSYTSCVTVDQACKESMGELAYSALTEAEIERWLLNLCMCKDWYKSTIDSNWVSSCVKK